MNNQGYIKSLNEWRVENMKLTEAFYGPNDQVKITNSGPMLHIRSKHPIGKNTKDFMLIEDSKKNEILRIDRFGDFYLGGVKGGENNSAKTLETLETLETAPEENDGILLGNPLIDGCWRINVDKNGNLIVSKKIKGAWITRQKIT